MTGVRRLVALSFVVYLVLLVWLVLWKLHTPYIGDAGSGSIKLVPFVSTATAGSSAPREALANVAVFVPLGLFLATLLPRWSWLGITAVAGFISASLEVTQYAWGIGVADITDVITNTTGALVGCIVVTVVRACKKVAQHAVRVLSTGRVAPPSQGLKRPSAPRLAAGG